VNVHLYVHVHLLCKVYVQIKCTLCVRLHNSGISVFQSFFRLILITVAPLHATVHYVLYTVHIIYGVQLLGPTLGLHERRGRGGGRGAIILKWAAALYRRIPAVESVA
jgi:hypothetical protein